MKKTNNINIHKFKSSGSSIKELDWQLHLMVSVPILFIVVFSIIPMFGIRLAFVEKYSYTAGIWHSKYYDSGRSSRTSYRTEMRS